MSHEEQFSAEKRQAKIVGYVAFVTCVVMFATIMIQLTSQKSGKAGVRPSKVDQFQNFDDSRGLALLAVGLRVVGLLLVIVLAKFLYDAIRLREESAPSYIFGLGVVGPVLLAVAAVLGFFALSHVVTQFVDLPGPQQTKDMADQLSDDYTFSRIEQVLEIVFSVVFAAWLVVVNAAGHGVGLIPKFLSYFGYGTAALTVLAPFAGPALLVGWIGSMGMLALDRWPGGRPYAWTTGKSEPVF